MRFVTFASLLFSSILLSFSPKKLDRDHAIKLAEDFVKRNGYTNAPADTSEYRLSYELNDRYANDIGALIRNRHNKLYPKAFCVCHNEQGWHVGFLYTSVELDKLDTGKKKSDLPGRSVTITGDNNYTEIDHKTPLFSQFEKLW